MRGKGEGSVFFQHTSSCPKDGRKPGDCDGRWVAQVEAGRDHNTGRRRYMRRTRKNRAAAMRALTDLKREASIPAAVEDIGVGEWCEIWLQDCASRVKAGTLAAKTILGYETDVRVHIIPSVGHLRLDKLAPGHVTRMMTEIQAKGRKPTTARGARRTLSAALSAAIADGIIEHNVARAARPPKVDRPTPSAFTAAEMERIGLKCKDHRLGNLFVFAALTGLRASELLGLRWKDIDLEEGTYQVVEGLHTIPRNPAERLGIDHGLLASDPKTPASAARTPLSPAAIEVLRRQRKQLAAEKLASTHWVDSGRVFTNTSGEELRYANVRRIWMDLLKKADVPRTTADGRPRGLHELRRTFATRLRDLNLSVEDVQRLGRWSTAQMLMNFYRALDEDKVRDAVKRADGDGQWFAAQ